MSLDYYSAKKNLPLEDLKSSDDLSTTQPQTAEYPGSDLQNTYGRFSAESKALNLLVKWDARRRTLIRDENEVLG
jgi:hypothetical protein